MNVALGVGGGIAAYKAAELTRALMERGFAVDVIMTSAAEEFVRPLTFAALTGRKVYSNLFAPASAASAETTLANAIEHIRLAQENQIFVVAPATADLMAKMAHGLAGDLLTTAYLAFNGPVVIAPAMNVNMWNHPATRENLRILDERRHIIVEPDAGALACGMVGPGRLAEPQRIAEAVADVSKNLGTRGTRGTSGGGLEGETVLITAGPTQEPIDGVRFISNRSSGKMGYALAEEAAARGAKVVLISGPVNLPAPANVTRVSAHTAEEMRAAVLAHLDQATIVIKAAAVADYHVAHPPSGKVKKTAARMTLDLEPTADILAEIGRRKGDRLLIGFAAETDHLAEEARRKLEQKNCDMIVGNLVSYGAESSTGFESDENEVLLVTRAESIPVTRASKSSVAQRILDQIPRLRLAVHARS